MSKPVRVLTQREAFHVCISVVSRGPLLNTAAEVVNCLADVVLFVEVVVHQNSPHSYTRTRALCAICVHSIRTIVNTVAGPTLGRTNRLVGVTYVYVHVSIVVLVSSDWFTAHHLPISHDL